MKNNRVDLLAEDEKGEMLLVEVQGEPEFAYFQRILFGTSKLVTEYIDSGMNYDNIKKVYSINIVYFDLGQGKDIVYHGKLNSEVYTTTSYYVFLLSSAKNFLSMKYTSFIRNNISSQ